MTIIGVADDLIFNLSCLFSFREKKNRRWRVSTAAEVYRSSPGDSSSTTPPQRRPITSYVPRQPYTEKQKKQLLMESLLHDVDLKPQNNNLLPKRRGELREEVSGHR